MKREDQRIQKAFTFDGKRYYVRGYTEAEVFEKIALRKKELEEGKQRITKNILLKDYFAQWHEAYKVPSVSPDWADTVEGIAKSVILSEIGNLRIKDVKPLHLQRILNDKADMSQSYIQKIYFIMDEMFRSAKQNGLIYENPAEGVKLPKGKKPLRRRAVTEKERYYILQTCEKHRSGLFYKIMLYCGLRPSEVAALKWRNIDLENRILTVDSNLKNNGTIGAPKTEAGYRKVPIPEVLAADLKERKGSPFQLVCTNAHGDQLTRTSMKQQWKSFRRQLNIEMGCRVFRGELVPPLPVADDLVPYCLRHTYCTDLQAAGVPINVARELMGHSDISITAKIYTHSSEESFEDAARAIEVLQQRRRNKISERRKAE